MQVVILCGGKGTRLYPLTKSIPKSMVEIFYKVPFIQYQLLNLKRNGLTNIVLCTGIYGDQIEKFVVDSESFGMNIKFSRESEPLGTGGALYNTRDLLDEHFSIIYGDSYLLADLLALQDAYTGTPLMSIYRNLNKLYPNNVRSNPDGTYTYDKAIANADYIDYGFITMSKADIVNAEELHFNTIDYIVVKEPFYEIGSIEGLRAFKTYIWRNELC